MREGQPEIFALFGNPVGHSLSPLMHTAAFDAMRRNACYVPFCVDNLAVAVQAVRALNMAGVSVTIPFKVDVMEYLDAVERDARSIGAVNTIVNRGGSLCGANTDWKGLVLALNESGGVKGRTCVILGAGGTARAAVFGIMQEGGFPIVVNRSPEKGRLLAAEQGCAFRSWQELREITADCLINTTPVGMAPASEQSPVEPQILGNFGLVVDVIYNPVKTRLLRDAERAGCAVLPGVAMFVHQGAEQIRLWTGQEPPRPLMSEIVRQALEAQAADERQRDGRGGRGGCRR